jgi:hypothetical protein
MNSAKEKKEMISLFCLLQLKMNSVKNLLNVFANYFLFGASLPLDELTKPNKNTLTNFLRLIGCIG